MTKSDSGSNMDWLKTVLKVRAKLGLYEDLDGWPDDFDDPALSRAVLRIDDDDRFQK